MPAFSDSDELHSFFVTMRNGKPDGSESTSLLPILLLRTSYLSTNPNPRRPPLRFKPKQSRIGHDFLVISPSAEKFPPPVPKPTTSETGLFPQLSYLVRPPVFWPLALVRSQTDPSHARIREATQIVLKPPRHLAGVLNPRSISSSPRLRSETLDEPLFVHRPTGAEQRREERRTERQPFLNSEEARTRTPGRW